MRIKTYALGITVALGVTAASFAGCGGTVAENQGTTTTGGGGKTTTSTSVSTTSSTTITGTTTVTTTTSSSTTGTSPCDMACAHIQMCTGYTCALANINCATIGSSYDCELECANNTPCAQLGLGTLSACQAQCAGDAGTGDGGAADAGMMISACSTCELTSCTTAGLACFQDATCKGWIGCANTCNSATPQDPSCYAACDAMYASASALYAPIYTCGCTNCATQCSGADLCAHGQDGGP